MAKHHGKPDVSWTDKVPGHPDGLVWGDVQDADLARIAESFGADEREGVTVAEGLRRPDLFAFISEAMPDGWKWEG
jgi:hypothetical protein